MQTSKNVFKRILLVILTMMFFVAGVVTFRFALTKVTVTDAVNWHMSQIEEKNENIDMFFVGGSRTYRSFYPSYFSKALGYKTIVNYGTPSQRPKLSYYLARELLKKNKPKVIVIGSTFNGLMYTQDPHSFFFAQNRLGLISQIECAIDHFGFNTGLLSLTGKSEYANNLIYSKIAYNISEKKKYKSGEMEEEMGDGHVASDISLKDGNINFEKRSIYRESDIKEDAEEYFYKLVDMCIESGAKVYLVTGPCSLNNVYRIKEYQKSIDFYKEIAEEKGIKYFNMNYIKDRDKLLPDNSFMDETHVNKKGGITTSEILSKVIFDDLHGKDTDHYFYKDLEELKSTIKRIPAIKTKCEKQNESTRISVLSIRNSDVTPLYRVRGKRKNKDYEVIHDWTTNSKFWIKNNDIKKYEEIRVEAKTNKNYPNEIIAYSILTANNWNKVGEEE